MDGWGGEWYERPFKPGRGCIVASAVGCLAWGAGIYLAARHVGWLR